MVWGRSVNLRAQLQPKGSTRRGTHFVLGVCQVYARIHLGESNRDHDDDDNRL